MRLLYGAQVHAPPRYDAPAVDVAHLHIHYPQTNALVVRDVSLQVARGELVALIGPNGAGKSTLLKAIAGLLEPEGGQIRVFGMERSASRGRVAYLPQRGDIDWRFPIAVDKLVLTGRYVHLGWFQRPQADDRERAAAALQSVGMGGLAQRQIGALSGGQQQRVLLARALVQDADLLLLDEPFNAVDTSTREMIVDTLQALQQQGKTAIVATHDLDRLAQDFDRVVALRDGRLVADRPAALYAPDQPIFV